MSVESIKKVIRLWEIGNITTEQCLGKLLLLLLEYSQRLTKLETEVRHNKQ
jgi:hypothetical protein